MAILKKFVTPDLKVHCGDPMPSTLFRYACLFWAAVILIHLPIKRLVYCLRSHQLDRVDSTFASARSTDHKLPQFAILLRDAGPPCNVDDAEGIRI